jgi:ATP-dependent helicase/nuclease subunit B
MTAPPPRLFDIPAGTPFLEALARGIRADLGNDPQALAAATVLLPNRRAVRGLGEAFLAVGDGQALLLPRIAAIGDVDEDALALADGTAALAAELPPAIDALARHLLLARLVSARGDLAPSPAAAFKLAQALGDLLDELQIEEIGFDRFADLVPADYAAHWAQTLAFLDILRDAWPNILAARGQMDGQARRAKLIRALAAHWMRAPPPGPIWAAGSTGSVPATAHLLATIARLPHGAVVLPGLDRAASAATWDAIGNEPSHPQYGLNQLLRRLEATRDQVQDWPGTMPGKRQALVAAALLPAPATAAWRTMPAFAADAFSGLMRIEAPDADSEAGAIALVLRETLETPGRTAALVTADRNLARRVAAKLKRWNIAVDDTAGAALARQPAATLLRLAARAIGEAFAPVAALALLKHPLVQLGRTRRAHLGLVRKFERKCLHGPRPAPGLEGLRALGTAPGELIDALAAAAAPLDAAAPTLAELLPAYVAFAQMLAHDETGRTRLWDGDAGEALADFVAAFAAAAADFGPLARPHFADFLDTVLAGEVLRPAYGGHPRLAIRGTLEARLVAADRIVLGGLNEGVWPADAREDPWLSRPMRKAVGLPPPERQIGQAAHDFAQALAADDVVLTRARKADGTPALPARWLVRLEALVGADANWQASAAPSQIAWDRTLAGADERGHTLAKPRPAPPVEARPTSLAVTSVETLIRDPYAIYARYVLRLRKLEPIDADIDARERGNLVHKALEIFVDAHKTQLPEQPLGRLMEIGRQVFAPHMKRPAVAAFWWPRFARIAEWFVGFEAARRANGHRSLAVETHGVLEFPVAGLGQFALKARADRIDIRADGRLDVIDYKTGTPASSKQVAVGIAPQLPLTAAVAKAGAFAGVPAAAIAELVYARLGGIKQAGVWKIAVPSKLVGDADAFADQSLAALQKLLADYAVPTRAYLARPRPQFVKYAGDYDHLARWLEWSREGDGDGA